MNEFDSPFWDWIAPYDTGLFRLLNSDPPYSMILDPLMLLLSSQYFWISVAALFILYAAIRRDIYLLKGALYIGLALAATDLFCYQLLKPYFDRLRPCHTLENVRLVASGCGGSWGYPSNHAANAMAVFWVIKSLFPKGNFWKISLVLGILIGYSRIHVGVHYPFDVVSGFVIGSAVSFVTLYVIKFLSPRTMSL
jgi:undecaprenyl-diphosphatase